MIDCCAGEDEGASLVKMPRTVRAVIFDGDDTLWSTEALYDAARNRVRNVVEQAGLNGDEWEQLQRTRDLANVKVLGHSAERFPASCVESYLMIGGKTLKNSEAVLGVVKETARSVFFTPAPLCDGAEVVLGQLVSSGVKVALLTKGDRTVQERRVSQSGLAHFFELVKVVSGKTTKTFLDVTHELGLRAEDVLSIGNSVESDIKPSLDARIYALWIPAYVWEFEQHHDKAIESRLHRIDSLRDVLKILET
jgi:putative hydrolase of the HAD superfamily